MTRSRVLAMSALLLSGAAWAGCGANPSVAETRDTVRRAGDGRALYTSCEPPEFLSPPVRDELCVGTVQGFTFVRDTLCILVGGTPRCAGRRGWELVRGCPSFTSLEEGAPCGFGEEGGRWCWETPRAGPGAEEVEPVALAASLCAGGVLDASSTEEHVCAVCRDTSLRCAGGNFDTTTRGSDPLVGIPCGQSGVWDEESAGPTTVLDSGAVGVATAFRSTCALTEAGDVVCWGRHPLHPKCTSPVIVCGPNGAGGEVEQTARPPIP